MILLQQQPFIIIRHGETEANAAQVASGAVDTPLTALGREQAALARAVVEALVETPAIRPTFFVHSHLSRARDTASIINQTLSLPMFEDADIGEQNFGDLQGRPWAEMRNHRAEQIDPPNGEAFADFYTRIIRGVNNSFTRQTGLPVLVSHGGVFSALYRIMGLPHVQTHNCEVYHFMPAAGGWTAQKLG